MDFENGYEDAAERQLSRTMSGLRVSQMSHFKEHQSLLESEYLLSAVYDEESEGSEGSVECLGSFHPQMASTFKFAPENNEQQPSQNDGLSGN